MDDPASPSSNTMMPPALARSRGLAQTIAEQRRQIKEFLASQRNRMDDVESRIAESLGRIIDELVRERSEAAGNLRELEDRAARLDQESRQLAETRADLDASRTAWEESRRSIERQQADFLEELRRELQQRPGGGGGVADNVENGEYQQRYEMSLDDIRLLREENKALADELEELKSRPSTAKERAKSAAPLSWEAQKQRLLASLEEGFDEDKPEDAAQRIEMKELVQTTDRALHEKDEEIAELRQILERQSESIGEVAVGAAAFGEIVDNDEIIRQERHSLKLLQEELRGKLRAAEIDISVERAKIARERVELDEKIRLLSQKRSGAVGGQEVDSGQEKPSRGRWLSRLGLNDLDK